MGIQYNLYLGGGFTGQRLNRLFRQDLTGDEIVATLAPMIRRFAQERSPGERFGDFVIRAGYVRPTLEGKCFHAGDPGVT
jgi:sulfite reductase (NADPH) hemoprotein beta-component